MPCALRVLGAAVLVAVTWPVRAADDALVVTHRARALAPGEVVAITVRAPEAVTAVGTVWRERPVTFVRRRDGLWHALVGVDVEEAPGPRSVQIVARRSSGTNVVASHPLTLEPKQWRTRQLKVAARFVDPPASALPRIRKESEFLNGVFRETRAEQLWAGPFARPVEGVAVSGFGVRSVLNGKPRGPHNGADFAAGTGTPIVAPAAAVVVVARNLYYSGNTVILDHGFGLFSTMAHLSAFDVREGGSVERGQLLGKVGATGRVTGPHLHWSVRLLGARVDPESLLAAIDE